MEKLKSKNENRVKLIEEKKRLIEEKKHLIEEAKKINVQYQKLKKEFTALNKSVCMSFKVRPDDRNNIIEFCTKRKIYPSEFFRDTVLQAKREKEKEDMKKNETKEETKIKDEKIKDEKIKDEKIKDEKYKDKKNKDKYIMTWKCPKCNILIESIYQNQFTYNKTLHIISCGGGQKIEVENA